MSDADSRTSPPAPRLPLRETAFFALTFIYVWRVIDPRLIYDAYWTTTQFPVFRTGGAFLSEFLRYPGGPAEYLQLPNRQEFALQDHHVGPTCGPELADPSEHTTTNGRGLEFETPLGKRPGERLDAIAIADVIDGVDQSQELHRGPA